jgi:hypothetical protein
MAKVFLWLNLDNTTKLTGLRWYVKQFSIIGNVSNASSIAYKLLKLTEAFKKGI